MYDKTVIIKYLFHRPETVYTAEENLRVLTWGNLQAYGNYVYFEIISMLPKEGDSQKEEIMVTITTGYIIKPLYMIYRRTKLRNYRFRICRNRCIF